MRRWMIRGNGTVAPKVPAANSRVRESGRRAAMHGPLTRIFGRLTSWRDRSRQRSDLAALDDHVLKDIGVSRAEVELEIHKRFRRH